jgi:hypothetical protein
MNRTYLNILHEPRLPPKPEASKTRDEGRTGCAMPRSATQRAPVLVQTQHVYQKQGRAFAGDLQRPSARQGGRIAFANVLASHPANKASRP